MDMTPHSRGSQRLQPPFAAVKRVGILLLLGSIALASGGCLAMRAHSAQQYANMARRAARQARAIADASGSRPGAAKAETAATAAETAADKAQAAADVSARAVDQADKTAFFRNISGSMDAAVKKAQTKVGNVGLGPMKRAERQRDRIQELEVARDYNRIAVAVFLLGVPADIVYAVKIEEAETELGRLVRNTTQDVMAAGAEVRAALKVLKDVAGGLVVEPDDDGGEDSWSSKARALRTKFSEAEALLTEATAEAIQARALADDDPLEAHDILKGAFGKLNSALVGLNDIHRTLRTEVARRGSLSGSGYEEVIRARVHEQEQIAKTMYEEAERQLQAARAACPEVAAALDQTDPGGGVGYSKTDENPDMLSGEDGVVGGGGDDDDGGGDDDGGDDGGGDDGGGDDGGGDGGGDER